MLKSSISFVIKHFKHTLLSDIIFLRTNGVFNSRQSRKRPLSISSFLVGNGFYDHIMKLYKILD